MTLTSHEDTEKARTLKQNACLHSYFGQLAAALNEAGYSLQTVVKLPISMTGSNVKENIAVKFIEALYPEKMREDGTYHTSDLDTKQLSYLYENMNVAMGEKFGVSLDWPTRFNGGVGK